MLIEGPALVARLRNWLLEQDASEPNSASPGEMQGFLAAYHPLLRISQDVFGTGEDGGNASYIQSRLQVSVTQIYICFLALKVRWLLIFRSYSSTIKNIDSHPFLPHLPTDCTQHS